MGTVFWKQLDYLVAGIIRGNGIWDKIWKICVGHGCIACFLPITCKNIRLPHHVPRGYPKELGIGVHAIWRRGRWTRLKGECGCVSRLVFKMPNGEERLDQISFIWMVRYLDKVTEMFNARLGGFMLDVVKQFGFRHRIKKWTEITITRQYWLKTMENAEWFTKLIGWNLSQN